jgi:hypothetical protein
MCGGPGEACCGGSVGCTAPFTVCQGSACVGCGGTGEPCCPGTGNRGWCSSGQACSGMGMCTACGGTGQACCAGSTCKSGFCAQGRCN